MKIIVPILGAAYFLVLLVAAKPDVQPVAFGQAQVHSQTAIPQQPEKSKLMGRSKEEELSHQRLLKVQRDMAARQYAAAHAELAHAKLEAGHTTAAKENLSKRPTAVAHAAHHKAGVNQQPANHVHVAVKTVVVTMTAKATARPFVPKSHTLSPVHPKHNTVPLRASPVATSATRPRAYLGVVHFRERVTVDSHNHPQATEASIQRDLYKLEEDGRIERLAHQELYVRPIGRLSVRYHKTIDRPKGIAHRQSAPFHPAPSLKDEPAPWARRLIDIFHLRNIWARLAFTVVLSLLISGIFVVVLWSLMTAFMYFTDSKDEASDGKNAHANANECEPLGTEEMDRLLGTRRDNGPVPANPGMF